VKFVVVVFVVLEGAFDCHRYEIVVVNLTVGLLMLRVFRRKVVRMCTRG
jgi:hypothetical protein